ncbi:SdiA-regulated domain-containing protein [Leucothrix mucor]|uniref:SdiA-regulated domain-containing protein n=1 Tax=Leucothrix mucor TaxID=45248 RepID=UPI0003B6BC62|nr:SdiA-regulated domain-containing protein [Leucothrix mucor]
MAEPTLSLDYISSTKLNDIAKDLDEPSGLTISASTGELWAISDDTSAVFRFSPTDPEAITTLSIKESEMEAITLAETAGTFYTINESKGRIASFSMADGKRLEREKIQDMEGYSAIRDTVKAAGNNNGFEGIAWHPERQSLFALLEGPPGLLVEISADLKRILSSTQLTADQGFVDSDKPKAAVDFSGLSYDATRKRFWIVSDQAARVFLYDLEAGKVTQSLPLYRLTRKGKRKAIDKAEGVVVSPDGNHLYVVSDSEASLYQWRIR